MLKSWIGAEFLFVPGWKQSCTVTLNFGGVWVGFPCVSLLGARLGHKLFSQLTFLIPLVNILKILWLDPGYASRNEKSSLLTMLALYGWQELCLRSHFWVAGLGGICGPKWKWWEGGVWGAYVHALLVSEILRVSEVEWRT